MTLLNSNDLRSWITCASYAVLNALDQPDIDLIEFENSTGVTFGVASYSSRYHCTRMLTPYRKFWDGISSLETIWGLHIEHICASSKNELLSQILSIDHASIILGPINMAALSYLPVSSQYQCADHYICMHKKGSDIYVTDSEGIPYMRVNEAYLQRLIDISNIMEAEESYHAGIVEHRSSPLSPKERRFLILEHARQNFQTAEEDGQGSNAFLICQHVMQELSPANWEVPFRYDLGYYMQRKHMMMLADPENRILRSAFREHLEIQISAAQQVLYDLSQRAYDDAAEKLSFLAKTEAQISMRWKERMTAL